MIQYIKNILQQKCPRCQKGKMFTHKWYQLSHITDMPTNCPVCGQKTELEVGFYYGTGYVSYALTVGFLVSVFVAWKIMFGLSFSDNSIFWFLGVSIGMLVLLQPWFMRIARVLWLSWFYHKDDDRLKKSKKTN
jgi:uncharacterized protein (DUF983 family)